MDEHLYNSAQKDEKMVTVVFKYNLLNERCWVIFCF